MINLNTIYATVGLLIGLLSPPILLVVVSWWVNSKLPKKQKKPEKDMIE